MTPKEKAKELVEKRMLYSYEINENKNFLKYIVDNKIKKEDAKQCALIAVDEILIAIDWHEFEYPNEQFEYWHEVKSEIEKI